MQYRVHIYAVVRIPVVVEADSQQDAIAKALPKADLYELDTTLADCDGEYADQVTGYLVDEVGDEEYFNPIWYDSDGHPDIELGHDVSCDLHAQMTEE